jgi:hypothetical protein
LMVKLAHTSDADFVVCHVCCELLLLHRLRQATTPKHSSLRGEPPKRALSLVVRPVNGLIRVPDVQDMFSNQSNMLKHCRVPQPSLATTGSLGFSGRIPGKLLQVQTTWS